MQERKINEVYTKTIEGHLKWLMADVALYTHNQMKDCMELTVPIKPIKILIFPFEIIRK